MEECRGPSQIWNSNVAAIAAAIRCGRPAFAIGRSAPLMAARLSNGVRRGESPLLFPLFMAFFEGSTAFGGAESRWGGSSRCVWASVVLGLNVRIRVNYYLLNILLKIRFHSVEICIVSN